MTFRSWNNFFQLLFPFNYQQLLFLEFLNFKALGVGGDCQMIDCLKILLQFISLIMVIVTQKFSKVFKKIICFFLTEKNLSSMPGNFPVDEESSDLTFVFWYTLQVHLQILFFFVDLANLLAN